MECIFSDTEDIYEVLDGKSEVRKRFSDIKDDNVYEI